MACNNKNCGCKDTGMTTPFPCYTPPCPNPEPCAETWSDCCVIHNGDSFAYVQYIETVNPGPRFTILEGERLCDTWQRFIAFSFCGLDAKIVYGLKHTNITTTSLTIAWTPLTGLTSSEYYEVFYSPVTTPLAFISAGTVPYNNTTPSLSINGLTPNTTYYVNIVVDGGTGTPCPSVSLILTTLPS